jgi:threonine dehydrogenase-like Zn-dependent dehydrogenase
VGQGVTAVKVGDKVAVEAGVNCGQCRMCNSGRYNLCPQSKPSHCLVPTEAVADVHRPPVK